MRHDNVSLRTKAFRVDKCGGYSLNFRILTARELGRAQKKGSPQFARGQNSARTRYQRETLASQATTTLLSMIGRISGDTSSFLCFSSTKIKILVFPSMADVSQSDLTRNPEGVSSPSDLTKTLSDAPKSTPVTKPKKSSRRVDFVTLTPKTQVPFPRPQTNGGDGVTPKPRRVPFVTLSHSVGNTENVDEGASDKVGVKANSLPVLKAEVQTGGNGADSVTPKPRRVEFVTLSHSVGNTENVDEGASEKVRVKANSLPVPKAEVQTGGNGADSVTPKPRRVEFVTLSHSVGNTKNVDEGASENVGVKANSLPVPKAEVQTGGNGADSVTPKPRRVEFVTLSHSVGNTKNVDEGAAENVGVKANSHPVPKAEVQTGGNGAENEMMPLTPRRIPLEPVIIVINE